MLDQLSCAVGALHFGEIWNQLVHCKFVLIQFPSFLLAQVQPECQFSHMYLSYHTGEAL